MFSTQLTQNFLTSLPYSKEQQIRPLLQIIKVIPIRLFNKYALTAVVSDGENSLKAFLSPNIFDKKNKEKLNGMVVKVMEYDIFKIQEKFLLKIYAVEEVVSLNYIIGSAQEMDMNQLGYSTLTKDMKNIFMLPVPLFDITIMVNGESLYAHKAILVARSPYFKALFLNGAAESFIKPDVLEMNDWDVEVMRSVLNWIYTDTLTLPADEKIVPFEESRIFKLWMASTFFCLNGLVGMVEAKIKANLKVDNVCEIWNKISTLDVPSINQICLNYFIKNMNKIIELESFLKLEKKLFVQAMNTIQKALPRPMPPLTQACALSKWILANEREKIPHIKKKLSSLNFIPGERNSLGEVNIGSHH